LIEAENPAGEQYSVGHLEALVRSNANVPVQEILEEIHASVVRFHGNSQLQDDMTVVVLKVANDGG
jgi:serine phosphatase RsbU (regulator of sigma subunit)